MARVVALFQAPWMPLVPLAQWYVFEILMLALTLPQGSKRRFYKAFFNVKSALYSSSLTTGVKLIACNGLCFFSKQGW